MAKAKKRVAARKKSSKRGKVNAKAVRKLAAKETTPKKAKSEVKRTPVSAKKPAATQKRRPQPMETAKPIGTMNVINEPAPGVTAVTEHESVQTTSISTNVQPERGEGFSPAGTSP
jgi:hypothetical protein